MLFRISPVVLMLSSPFMKPCIRLLPIHILCMIDLKLILLYSLGNLYISHTMIIYLYWLLLNWHCYIHLDIIAYVILLHDYVLAICFNKFWLFFFLNYCYHYWFSNVLTIVNCMCFPFIPWFVALPNFSYCFYAPILLDSFVFILL